jgi:hypothetical protein
METQSTFTTQLLLHLSTNVQSRVILRTAKLWTLRIFEALGTYPDFSKKSGYSAILKSPVYKRS